jgi:tyrosyl-tRNA synthetase
LRIGGKNANIQPMSIKDKNEQQKIEELLTRGVVEIIDREGLEKKIKEGKKLRVKLGIDPTSPNIHIGRAIPLLKLRDFQELGHQIVLIIGDFTGVIGDTSDKESERPMLTREAVKENMKNYADQAGKILDMSKVELRYNSEWLGKLDYGEIGEQADQFSLSDFIARENIKKRLDEGIRVSLREVLYPLMQGYDSVAIEADVELGGTDQRFNLLAGRDLQRHFKQEPQSIIMGPLLEGADGKKMSSSWENTINLTTNPADMYGKVMSISDDLIVKYFTLTTRVSLDDIKKIEKDMKADKLNPRDIKMKLAYEIVKMYHGEDDASKAQESFVKLFQKKEIPEDLQEIKVKIGDELMSVLADNKIVSSKTDFRRLAKAGAVDVDGEAIKDEYYKIEKSAVVKVGKKKFLKIIL